MKRALGFAYLSLIVLGLIHVLSPGLEAQNRIRNGSNQPRDGACFYLDADYRGDSFCMNAGESRRNVENRYNDKISSVRVFGRAQVIVYEHENFGGASRTFTGDASNLRDWNDRITSIRVQYDRIGFSGSGNEPQNGVCFYLDADYRGEKFCVNSDESQRNLGERYNDRISSIRIFGRAEVTVYDDENFNGSRQTFRQDVPNLRDWNDRITSFQVTGGQYGGQYEGQYGGRSSGYEPRNGACFYLDMDHRGDSFCMNAGESRRNVEDRFNDKISSIRVFGRARVVVYEHENFGGASRTIAGDVSNLGNFNDKITSIEVK
jgi:dUTPase